jgi:D-lactate dehydrogenase
MPLKPRIAVYNLWPELVAYAEQGLKAFPHSISTDKLTNENVDASAEILVVFIESPVTAEHIAKMPKLKYIATMSTGYDHVDLVAAEKKGILVANVPSYGENTVAEHTFALILGLTRKLFDSVKRVKEGVYDFHGLRGTDLMGKTIGIIGTGHIGSHVARMAKGFEMNVTAYDKFKNAALAKKIGFTYVPLNTLLKKSDIVSLHMPLFKETTHLINSSNISLMKPGAFLINTARGALIEPEALLNALTKGTLGGAGLDVLEDENLLQHVEEVMSCKEDTCKLQTTVINNLLIDSPKTIVTPHNAFNSSEALQRIVDVTLANIGAFAKGKPQNLVHSR